MCIKKDDSSVGDSKTIETIVLEEETRRHPEKGHGIQMKTQKEAVGGRDKGNQAQHWGKKLCLKLSGLNSICMFLNLLVNWKELYVQLWKVPVSFCQHQTSFVRKPCDGEIGIDVRRFTLTEVFDPVAQPHKGNVPNSFFYSFI